MNQFILMIVLISATGLISIFATESSYSPMIEQYRNNSNMLKQCEKALPRNQYCVLKAVPFKDGETSEDRRNM